MIKRCAKCVLPSTIPNISFDENGVCQYCNQYEKSKDILIQNKQERDKTLVKLFDQAKRRRSQGLSKYDVLVPLSGGRDSSYVAYALTKIEGLKILCIYYDNPFSSSQAKKNVQTIVKTLNIDLVSFRWPDKRHEKSFENNFRAWLLKPDLGTTGLLCLACKPMYLKFYQVANKHNIQLIVDGSNPNEATQFKLEARIGEKKKPNYLTSVAKMAKKTLKNWRYIRPCNFIPLIHTLMSLDGGTPYLRLRYPKISKHGYFYCRDYNENQINATLDQLGWKKASDNKSPWRFDCEIDTLKNYLFKQLVGATEKEDLFSKNIRAGLMTREEALQRLDESEINMEILERVLNKVNMSLKDITIGQCKTNLLC